jgi:hypothetical protein
MAASAEAIPIELRQATATIASGNEARCGMRAIGADVCPWHDRRVANGPFHPPMHTPSMPHSALTRAIGGGTLAVAVFWLLSAVVAIVNYGFRYPAFDQFLNYRRYFSLPYPENVLQLENGHRPILPALVRLAEIEWLQANQLLQLGVGLGCALAALMLIASTLLRDRDLAFPVRAALVLCATLSLLWLGNARMLMHGNESLHTYSVLLFTILGALALQRACDTQPVRSMALAALCCVAATFCYGSGIASFAALFVGAWVVRMPARSFALPAALLALSLAVYVGGLPGHAGVRHSLLAHPKDSIEVLLVWLSTPWITAWLGLGGTPPSFMAWVQASASTQLFGRLAIESATALAEPWGARWINLATFWIGTLGFVGYAVMLAHARRAGAALSRVRFLAVVLATLAIAIGTVLAVTRLPLFRAIPEQVMADRYQPWNCLFWLGLALYAGAAPAARLPREFATVALALLAAALLYPTHRAYAAWSETVHRIVQQSALAAQLGVWDPERFPDGPDASRDDVLATLAAMRERRLSMFAEPGAALARAGFVAPAALPPAIAGAHARVVRTFADTLGGGTASALEGAVPDAKWLAPGTLLAVVDRDGLLQGLARPSHVANPVRPPLRIDRTLRTGFDGYARGNPCAPMTVVVLTEDLRPRGTIPVQPPSSCPALPAPPPGGSAPGTR